MRSMLGHAMSFEALFYPRAVAVVGSTSQGKVAYELIRQIRAGGYRDVYAVNPKAQGLDDVPGFHSVADVGCPVDLAIIASPAATVTGVLEDCGKAGVRAAVVISAGFAEAGNRAGEEEIKRVAGRLGIRIVGPNCAGMANTGHALYATLETRPPQGVTALVSQSGALAGAVLAWASEQGLGFSKFVSYGNRADLGEADFLSYLAEDDETRVVALYIESVRDGRAFMAALEQCAARKPVVVIKAGRTQTGQRATLSHTGSLAGSDAVYDAALRQCGAIRVKTVEEMFDVCKGFVYLPPVRGRRIAIVTNSGGPGVLAADVAEEIGLDVAEPGPELRACLSELLPAHSALKNPFDLTVEGTETGYRETLAAALGEYDAALALNVAPPYLDSVALARGVCDAAQRSGKPVVANFMSGETVAAGVAYLNERGIPNFPIGERAVNVLEKMARYHAFAVERQNGGGRAAVVETRPLPGEGHLLEPEAMAWLGQNGIPVPELRTADNPAEAVEMCREIGYPVVMKVVSPDILHKSDCGGVVLDITSDQAAWDAFAAIQRSAGAVDFRGVVIYPLVRGGQEVLLGLSRDPQFGPVVACGLGGVYTEILHDIALRVAPVRQNEAMAMIHELRSVKVLQGARGRPSADLQSLAGAIVALSQLPFRYPEISEVDLNPVFVLPEGLIVGDVRVIATS